MIENEIDIVWLDDPTKYRYLREQKAFTTQPRAKIAINKDDILIGYAVSAKNKDRGAYFRRFWFLRKYDRDFEPSGIYGKLTFQRGPAPTEAVLPNTIEVGKPSQMYSGSSLWREDVNRRSTMESGST
jgi:hypothetical protein